MDREEETAIIYATKHTARSQYARRLSEARRLVDALIIQLDLATRIITCRTIANGYVDVVPEFPTTGVRRRGLLFNSKSLAVPGLESTCAVLYAAHVYAAHALHHGGGSGKPVGKTSRRQLMSFSSSRLHHGVLHSSGHTTTGIWSGLIMQLKLVPSIMGRHDCLNKPKPTLCVQLLSGLERRRVYRNNAQVCAHIPKGTETDAFPVSFK